MARLRDAKLDDLRRAAVLRGLPVSELAAVAKAGEIVVAAGGAVLERRGEPRACWWLVLDGTVVVDGTDGAAVVVRGDGWGADAALRRQPAAATATAVSDVRCLVVDPLRLEPLLHDAPGIAVALLRRPRSAAVG